MQINANNHNNLIYYHLKSFHTSTCFNLIQLYDQENITQLIDNYKNLQLNQTNESIFFFLDFDEKQFKFDYFAYNVTLIYEKASELQLDNINVISLFSNFDTFKNLILTSQKAFCFKNDQLRFKYQIQLIFNSIEQPLEFELFSFDILEANLNSITEREIISNVITKKLNLNSTNNQSIEIINSNEDIKFEMFDNVVLGGTFDHLHAGHKVLLGCAAAITNKRIVIGITGSIMLRNKKFAEYLQSFEIRCENVRKFINLVNPKIAIHIEELSDPFGPSVVDPDLQALVVSKETIANGELVNVNRLKRNHNPIQLFIVNLVAAPSHLSGDDTKISSTTLRQIESFKKK
eukprot:TRINITY_DN1442_c1_g1_i1.p1 TRINITY_DN1442_c1_g1~~TRINITY_DN1442_c1_g1_i1.p1  ORF type:complete len:362 (+),score=108.61 TRINITY_DN1442_c1_g1_i1:48-1088(+)